MARILLPSLCLLAGATAGWLFGRDPGAAAPAPTAPASDVAAPPVGLLAERNRLRARVDELEARKAERERAAAWRERLADPVRRVGATDDPATGVLTFLVRDPRGRPIGDATVTVNRLGSPFTATAKTDAAGAAAIGEVPAGDVYVAVRTDTSARMFRATVEGGGRTEIAVEPPIGSATLSGVVRDREAGPVPGVRLVLSRQIGNSRDWRYAASDDGGEYRFDGVPAGPWLLTAGGASFGKGRVPGVEIDVRDGETVSRDLVAGLESLSGRVTDARTGDPLVGAEVFVRDRESGGESRDAATDESGRYSLRDLPGGTWQVVVRHDGYVSFATGDVETKPGRERGLPVELEPAVRLRLRVAGPDGEPFTGSLYVTCRPRGGAPGSPRTVRVVCKEGEARPEGLPAGDFDLTASDPKSGARGTAPAHLAPGGENRVEIRLGR